LRSHWQIETMMWWNKLLSAPARRQDLGAVQGQAG
jgi:hypothetical protein